MNGFVRMLEALNRKSHELNLKARQLNIRAHAWSEAQVRKTQYQAAANTFIKSTGFVDELEMEVMHGAACKRNEWRRTLSAELSRDDVLTECFSKALEEFSPDRPRGGLGEVDAEQLALKFARELAETERRCRADPEFRRIYEQVLSEMQEGSGTAPD